MITLFLLLTLIAGLIYLVWNKNLECNCRNVTIVISTIISGFILILIFSLHGNAEGDMKWSTTTSPEMFISSLFNNHHQSISEQYSNITK